MPKRLDNGPFHTDLISPNSLFYFTIFILIVIKPTKMSSFLYHNQMILGTCFGTFNKTKITKIRYIIFHNFDLHAELGIIFDELVVPSD